MKLQAHSPTRQTQKTTGPAAPARQNAAPSAPRESGKLQAAPHDRAQVRREKEAPAGATPNFGSWGTLKRDHSGENVRSLQDQLNSQGARLRQDGIFGPQTEKAVRNFQGRQGLTQDGKVGNQTQNKLKKGLTLKDGMLLSHGSQGQKVRGLQHLLNRHGDNLEKDGKFGEKTRDAVRKFQEAHQLKVDGIVGPETLKALNARPQKSPPRPEPQAQPRPEPQAQPKPEPQAQPEVPKPQDFGLNQQQLSQLQKGGRLETLRGLPPQAAERIAKIPPETRQKFAKDLQGSTFGVSHREAFVNGRAMGMDTFQIMDEKLQDAQNSGKISPKEAASMRADLKQLKALTPKQRDAIAELFSQSLRRG